MENVTQPRLGVLISGRGSNLQAIIDAIATRQIDAAIAIVISNVRDAPGLDRARAAGIDTFVMAHQDFPSRTAYDRALADTLLARKVDLVCLAGFMRLLSASFLGAFPNRVLNIHPSLLPAFPGMDAQQQALAYGVKIAGATVHIVTPQLDAGPIIVQSTVPVHADDTVESLSGRILAEEHRLYPEAINIMLGGAWRVDGRRFLRTGRAAYGS